MNAVRNWLSEQAVMTSSAAGREGLIAGSFKQLIGRELVPSWSDPGEAMWHQPTAIVAHGTEDDPILFYGNRTALELFEMPAETFVTMPSRLSAEPLEREARTRMMERVTQENFIDDYCGIRISSTGKRFRIEQAIVWNLLDETGALCGQAAMFDRWTSVE